jgi:hypothetical protein
MAVMDDGGSTPGRTLRWVLTGLVMIVVGLVLLFRDRGHDDHEATDGTDGTGTGTGTDDPRTARPPRPAGHAP